MTLRDSNDAESLQSIGVEAVNPNNIKQDPVVTKNALDALNFDNIQPEAPVDDENR